MFPNGWPGRGLLLLRVVNAIFVIHEGLAQLLGSQQTSAALLLHVAAIIVAASFLVGFMTPIVGALLAALKVGMLFQGAGRLEETILSVAIALSIAMLGPGVWSVDAAIFGWHRLEFPKE
jgi:uncharacterized membrane protein YphA (DoxX/SURF4 family)